MLKNFLIPFLFCLLATKTAFGAGSITMEVEVTPGSGDDPMIMVWLENEKGEFIRTLQTFTKHKEYFKDLTVWWGKREKAKADTLDAVMGPTIKWGGKKSATVPLVIEGNNILSGNFKIRIEQRKDKGGHYKKMTIPLTPTFASGVVKGDGYITQIKFTLKK
jgi:hypothetical protein